MGRISCPDFIGRAAELDALGAALDRARAGRAPAVLVGGEAGIGKSRLVGEFSLRARSAALVLRGACAPFGTSPPPFMPVVEALRAYAHGAGEEERARLCLTAPALTRLLPELERERSAWQRPDAAAWQSVIFEQLLAALEDVASARPLVLVLEDLHWADRSTLDLLALRSQTTRVAGCAIVVTYRLDELDPGHPLRLLLAELQRSGETDRLELGRFGRDELVAQLTGILGHPPGYRVVQEILERSDGNPFLAEELLAASGETSGGAPTRVRDIVMARVETLSEPTQRVLGVLSAARQSMSHHAVVAVADMPERDLDRSLREALARHVLVRTDDGAYAFRHALTREAIYDGLLVGERERLHRRLALALDAMPITSADVPSELLADRAHHWYHAGDRCRALRAAIEAGLAADEVYAPAEALTQYERALELWEHVEDPEHVAGIDAIALRARAAEAASFVGEPLRAAHMIERALEDVDPAAEPIRAGLLRERLGRYAWIGGDIAYALLAYEEAVHIIPSTPASVERARTLAAFAHAQFIANRCRVARELCGEALDIARAVAARTEEGRALATLGAAVASLGDRPAGLAMIREGRALLERADASHDHVFVTYSYEAGALADGGALEEAIDAVRPGIELMRQHGMHRSHQSWLEGMVVLALIKLGRWTEATALVNAALARGPEGITRRMMQLHRAELQLGRGEVAAASETVAQARRAAEGDQPFVGKLCELTASLAATRGDYAAARLAVARGMAALKELDDVQASARLCSRGIAFEADRAERARAQRHKPEAAAAVHVAEDLFDDIYALGGLPAARSLAEFPAIALTCAAELSRAIDHPTADQWLAAAGAWESLHQPYPQACCLARAAETALADRRRRADIAAWLRCAHEIASDLPAAPLTHAVESIAQRGRIPLSARSLQPPDPPRAAPLGITPREIEVLRLIARGYTNARIGDTLFISRKTASAHVSNILAKLEVSRRAEAAAIAERLGLLDEPAPQPPRS